MAAVNKDVNRINEAKLENLEGKLLTINAAVLQNGVRNHKPKIEKSGMIYNTPLQYILKLKVRARVMLTYNLDVSDGLTNGTLGESG